MESLPVDLLKIVIRFADIPWAAFVCRRWYKLFSSKFLKNITSGIFPAVRVEGNRTILLYNGRDLWTSEMTTSSISTIYKNGTVVAAVDGIVRRVLVYKNIWVHGKSAFAIDKKPNGETEFVKLECVEMPRSSRIGGFENTYKIFRSGRTLFCERLCRERFKTHPPLQKSERCHKSKRFSIFTNFDFTCIKSQSKFTGGFPFVYYDEWKQTISHGHINLPTKKYNDVRAFCVGKSRIFTAGGFVVWDEKFIGHPGKENNAILYRGVIIRAHTNMISFIKKDIVITRYISFSGSGDSQSIVLHEEPPEKKEHLYPFCLNPYLAVFRLGKLYLIDFG